MQALDVELVLGMVLELVYILHPSILKIDKYILSVIEFGLLAGLALKPGVLQQLQITLLVRHVF